MPTFGDYGREYFGDTSIEDGLIKVTLEVTRRGPGRSSRSCSLT
jgi:hypothetical protein